MNYTTYKKNRGLKSYKETHCWCCHSHISSSYQKQCEYCGGYICSDCGSCYQDCEYHYHGFNFLGQHRAGLLYNEQGFDRDGYNVEGYDKYGFDRHGFDAEGYSRSGYDVTGFDRQGRDKGGYDKDGYDINGFDKAGYDRNGFNSMGFDKNDRDVTGECKYKGKKIFYKGFNLTGVINNCDYKKGKIIVSVKMSNGRTFMGMDIIDCLEKRIVSFI